jgi:hypothetical protein
MQPSEQVDPLLAVCNTRVLVRNDGVIKDRLASFKVEPVVMEVGSSLALIPCDHPLNVATKRSSVKLSLSAQEPALA